MYSLKKVFEETKIKLILENVFLIISSKNILQIVVANIVKLSKSHYQEINQSIDCKSDFHVFSIIKQ